MSENELIVPAAEANRSFSRLLRAVREGKRITITSHGEPVAALVPAIDAEAARQECERRGRAREALLAHWRTITPMVVGAWRREQLYERS